MLGGSGRFFRTPEDVAELIDDAEGNPAQVAERGRLALEEARRYDWDDVTDRYELLCHRLASGSTGQHSKVRRKRGG